MIKKIKNAMNSEIGGIVKEIAMSTPQGRLAQDISATKQAFKTRNEPKPVEEPAPAKKPFEELTPQQQMLSIAAESARAERMPHSVLPPSRPVSNRLRGTLTEPRTTQRSSAEIQERARTGAAEQRARLGLPQGLPQEPPAPPIPFTPTPQQVKSIEGMYAQNLALGRITPPATTAEIAQQAPPITSPAGTRANKRKSNRGIGAYGQSLINLNLPK